MAPATGAGLPVMSPGGEYEWTPAAGGDANISLAGMAAACGWAEMSFDEKRVYNLMIGELHP